jgi:hypothetical protein
MTATQTNKHLRTMRKMLRGRASKAEKLEVSLNQALSAMRKGQALHLTHEWYGEVWWLTDGRRLKPEVAKALIDSKRIADVGDSLLPADAPAQTWRLID